MPRRKQGHPHAYKCTTGASERGSRGRSRGRSATASRSGPKSFGCRKKTNMNQRKNNAVKTNREDATLLLPTTSSTSSTSSTTTAAPMITPDDEERYLHKKFQRADCRSPSVSARTPSNAETDDSSTKPSKALEALLKVTELEIIRSSTQPAPKQRGEAEEEEEDELVVDETKKTKVGKHVCHYCNHSFAKPSVLEKHVRAHTDERPYPCSLCGFAFKTKSNLYKHKKSRAHTLKMNETKTADSPVESETESDDQLSETCDNKQNTERIAPIKMQTLVENKEKDLKTNHVGGVGGIVYKPKFHSAFFGGSRKFIEQKNFSTEIDNSTDDGLLLRVDNNNNSNNNSNSASNISNGTKEPSETESTSKNKSTKLTSPEYLKQHISNIISRNTAIVETLNPLWSRRFLRQSSVASSQNVDAELRARDKNGQSKLANALLRQEQDGRTNGTQSLPATPSIMGLMSPQFLVQVKNKLVESTSTAHSAATSTCIRVSQESAANGSNVTEPVGEQHPQNPEGSIIKNLLLTNRQAAANVLPSVIVTTETDDIAASDSIHDSQSIHTCPMCRTSFRCPETLLAHQNHYCKKNQQALVNEQQDVLPNLDKKRKAEGTTPKPRGRPKGSKNRPKDSKVQSPVSPACASPFVYSFGSNDTHGKTLNALKGKLVCRQASDGENDKKDKELDTGAILKKQLLLGGDKSPPLKKRKISEDLLASEEPKPVAIQPNATSTLRSLEELSRHPMRANALQMFGGEVQIFDGNDRKKIRIDAQMQQNHQRTPGLLTPHGHDVEMQGSNLASTSTVVVTIAKPVLNSGGTVMQMHDSKVQSAPSMCIPVVALGKPIVSTGFDRAESTSEFVPKFNQVGAVVLTSSLPPPPPHTTSVKTPGFYSIDISHLQINATLGSSKMGAQSPSTLSDRTQSSDRLPTSTITKQPPLPVEPKVPTITVQNANNSEKVEDASPTKLISLKRDEKTKNLLAPPRPTSLPLKSLRSSMTGMTLISPETPRPKKKYGQLYINGQYYTYLGLKCSTRVYYCCLHPPQPMYVPQGADSKLSMYSNWQTVPSNSNELNPATAMACYESRQRKNNGYSIAGIKKLEYMLTHSSYWTFKQREKEKDERCDEAEKCDIVQIPVVEDRVSPLKETSSVEKENVKTTSPMETETPIQLKGKHKSKDSCPEAPSREPKRVRIFEGGYKSNEEYTYIRGRGRGKYVCEECGIRCKKPSMLKKHIRTHTDVRPFTCKHCNFSFKTKGNLTKHMKSKAHHKKCVELGIDPVPVSIDDAHIDEEALARQEKYEKEFGKCTDDDDEDDEEEEDDEMDEDEEEDEEEEEDDDDEVDSVKSEEKRKKIVIDAVPGQFDDAAEEPNKSEGKTKFPAEEEVARSLLDLSNHGNSSETLVKEPKRSPEATIREDKKAEKRTISPTPISVLPTSASSILEFRPGTPYEPDHDSKQANEELIGNPRVVWQHKRLSETQDATSPLAYVSFPPEREMLAKTRRYEETPSPHLDFAAPVVNIDPTPLYPPEHEGNPVVYLKSKSRFSPHFGISGRSMDAKDETGVDEPMDLSVGSVPRIGFAQPYIEDGAYPYCASPRMMAERRSVLVSPCRESNLQANNAGEIYETISPPPVNYDHSSEEFTNSISAYNKTNGMRLGCSPPPVPMDQVWEMNEPQMDKNCSMLHAYLTEKQTDTSKEKNSGNGAPTIQMRKSLELTAGPSVASTSSGGERIYIGSDGIASKHRSEFVMPLHRSMDDGKCVCNICNKPFTKSSQLRLHVNIHYFERPFRCDSCAVSFRTKGHLQKHKRSVSHYNKVNMNMTFGTPTTDNPRPFKCIDCKIAFRIHGHLAKHLRSKMHIMKLECLGKLPFGTYAEIERSGVNLSEIDTTDCENSLDSLRTMAQRFYDKDPRRQPCWPRERTTSGCSTDDGSDIVQVTDDPAEGGARYRSLSLNEVGGRVSPDCEDVELLGTQAECGTPGMKREPHERVRNDTFPPESQTQHPAWEQMLRHQSIESLGQEYEDISDAESEPDGIAACSLCRQVFKDMKTLQLHVYVDHPEARDSAMRPPRTQPPHSRIRSVSLNADSSSAVEMTADGLPNDVAVAMEIRRNTLSENAAIAMEMRRTNSFSDEKMLRW